MSEYVIDEQGKWLIHGSARLLVEPSEEYIRQRELEEQQRQEEEKNRPPTMQETIDLMGQELTRVKVENIQKDNVIDTLGQELTDIKLKLLLGGM